MGITYLGLGLHALPGEGERLHLARREAHGVFGSHVDVCGSGW